MLRVPSVQSMFRMVTLVALMVVSLVSESAEGQDFKWGLAKGERLSLVLNQTSTATTECRTRVSNSISSVQLHLDWQVTDASDDSITIEQRIQQIVLRVKPATEAANEIVVDTADETALRGMAKDIRASLLAIVNVPIRVEMSRRGAITEVGIPAELENAIREAANSAPLQNSLTPEGLQSTFSQSMFVFPERELKPGDGWQLIGGQVAPFEDRSLQYDYSFVGSETIDGRELNHFALIISAIEKDDSPHARTTDSDPADPPPELVSVVGDGTFYFDSKFGSFSSCTSECTLQTKKTYRDLVFNTTVQNKSELKITRN